VSLPNCIFALTLASFPHTLAACYRELEDDRAGRSIAIGSWPSEAALLYVSGVVMTSLGWLGFPSCNCPQMAKVNNLSCHCCNEA